MPSGPVVGHFKQFFHEQYQPRKCGENALNFLKGLERDGQDISPYTMVQIENKGFSVFGMVNAEKARTVIRGERTTDEANWYHHVFVLDSSGRVFDFDYLSEPTIKQFSEYAEDMFLFEKECSTPISGKFCAGREEKLDNYVLSFFRAKDALANQDKPYWKGNLREALKR